MLGRRFVIRPVKWRAGPARTSLRVSRFLGARLEAPTRRQDAPVSKPEPHSSFVLQADCGPNMPGSGAAPSIDDMMK